MQKSSVVRSPTLSELPRSEEDKVVWCERFPRRIKTCQITYVLVYAFLKSLGCGAIH